MLNQCSRLPVAISQYWEKRNHLTNIFNILYTALFKHVNGRHVPFKFSDMLFAILPLCTQIQGCFFIAGTKLLLAKLFNRGFITLHRVSFLLNIYHAERCFR